jgi:glycosyltransferase involved in cell wall biosynthesis
VLASGYFSAIEREGGGELTAHPLVSIVTPSFNQGRYIEETIQSVLDQDYPSVEYLVLDGGSTDDTLAILRRYDERLRWVSEKDRGQADAINKGFHMATGEILGWLNSDDTYLPGTIRKVVEYFQLHPDVGMVYGEGYHIDAVGRIIERYYTEPFSFKRLAEICFLCQPTVFLRAEVIRTIGPLDITLHYCLDYDYWMRVAKRFRIGYLGEYLANSRLHGETKTLSQRVSFHQEILQTVKKHFGRVPVRWLYAYAHTYLSEKLLPHLQGLYADGWASQRASIFVQQDWGQYRYLYLEGELSRPTYPMSLRITVAGRVLYTTIIKDHVFSIREPLWEDGIPVQKMEMMEVSIDADTAFSPEAFGISGDTRILSYRVHKLALADERGAELVLYSDLRARLLRLALPLLVSWKSLLVNHDVPDLPYQELRRDLWQLRVLLHRPRLSRKLGGSSR